MAEPLGYHRTLFVETQAPRGRWMIPAFLPGIVLVGMTAWGIYTRGLPNRVAAFMMIGAGVALPFVILSQRLVTVVTSHELKVRYWFLRTRRINLADIVEARAETYEPIREFGGWGIKWSLRDRTTGYTITGNRGVRLTTARGEKLLIGSQRADELLQAIESGRATAFRAA